MTTVQAAIPQSDTIFEIHKDGERIARLRTDGELEVNPKFSTHESAAAFWTAVMGANPVQRLHEENERLQKENLALRKELRLGVERSNVHDEISRWQSKQKERRRNREVL